MSEQAYYLMHKNDVAASVTIDDVTGAMLRVSPKTQPELLPLGGRGSVDDLRRWWQRRAVPASQGVVRRFLEQMGFPTPQLYMVRNLGLSLSDHYWIKPAQADLAWPDVSLFSNDFRDPVGKLSFSLAGEELPAVRASSYSPGSSLQGDLKKTWIISGGKRMLIKGNHGANSQESLNEVAATLLHRKQGRMPFVEYLPYRLPESGQYGCICEDFCSEKLELIPAIDVVQSEKKDNAVSVFAHFIRVCERYGLPESVTRPFLEYQILSDFVLTNVDRHLNNFGVLRDTETLRFVSMAPIFDSGNSMFWDAPGKAGREDLTKIEVNSFRGRESQLLDYVTMPGLFDPDRAPSPEELRAIYALDSLIAPLDAILLAYEKKLRLLQERFSGSRTGGA
ncbi:MAG: excisionase [Lachnospiraceae bacterium]|nr:excisionase [Lachnospiraceae bacterium]